MNYKIFQICFEPKQIEQVEAPLTAFDNTLNERPELREFHSFVKANETGATKDLDAWGFLGPRWETKLKYSADDMCRVIEENPDNDVWLFNHARVVNALTYNVWEQGEMFHKGLIKVGEETLKIAGYDPKATVMFMKDDTTCYCSYFVARKEFWDDYIQFLRNIIDAIDKLPNDVKSVYESSANYSRDSTLNMFPFLVERLFSTFLVLNYGKYNVYHKPYDYNVYRNQVGDFVDVLAALNDIKTEANFNQWNAIRMFFAKNNSELFNLD